MAVESLRTHQILHEVNPLLPSAKSKHAIPVKSDEYRTRGECRYHHRDALRDSDQLQQGDGAFLILSSQTQIRVNGVGLMGSTSWGNYPENVQLPQQVDSE